MQCSVSLFNADFTAVLGIGGARETHSADGGHT